jgi:hypothetical protein
MLTERFGSLDLSNIIKDAADFAPFPKASDRAGWGKVLPDIRQAWLELAEQYKDFTWPALPVGLCLHFQRTGENLTAMHKFWARRTALGTLAIAECIEGKGRFIDQIVSGIYTICEETVWMTPFDLGALKQTLPAPEDRIVNLTTSETGSLLAWVYYLFRDQLDVFSPRICRRIEKEIKCRLVEPYISHDDYWWMGFVPTPRLNNWNPWCNRNILMCVLLLDIDKEARLVCIHKVMRSLDSYLEKYPSDGCCDEGPMYWGASGGGLHTCLELLCSASSGTINVFDEPIVKLIGQYIYKAHICGDWFVDFADSDARVRTNATMYHYGLSIGDEHMVKLGASARPTLPIATNWFVTYEFLLDIFGEDDRRKAALNAPYVRDAWMWHTKMMYAREHQGSPEGLYLAAKAGHNEEAHNHNDTGSFVLYADGNPVLVDLGTEEYSAKTFSPQRFELWFLQSQYHDCPTVRGAMQHEGMQYAAKDVVYEANNMFAELRADISGAYPAEAGMEYWRRTCRLNRGDSPSVVIIDDYKLTGSAASVEWNLMTPLKPQQASPGRIEVEYAPGERAAIFYDADSLNICVEAIDFMESRLRRNWGDVMYRIVLSEKSKMTQAVRTVIIRKI